MASIEKLEMMIFRMEGDVKEMEDSEKYHQQQIDIIKEYKNMFRLSIRNTKRELIKNYDYENLPFYILSNKNGSHSLHTTLNLDTEIIRKATLEDLIDFYPIFNDYIKRNQINFIVELT